MKPDVLKYFMLSLELELLTRAGLGQEPDGCRADVIRDELDSVAWDIDLAQSKFVEHLISEHLKGGPNG
jgi:hypothetical protein